MGEPAVITGVERLVRNLRRFQRSLPARMKEELHPVAVAMKEEIKENVSFPYKTLPNTYTGGDPKGHFSVNMPSVANTAWERQVQLYQEPPHHLRNRLKVITTSDSLGVRAEVGYAEGVGDPDTPTRYIYWVIHGTRKMQPRNFLAGSLTSEWQAEFDAAIERAVARAVAAAMGG